MSKLMLLTRSTLGLVLWSRRLLFDNRTRSTNARRWLALPGVLALIGLQFGYIDSAVSASNEITCSATQHGKTIALGQAKLFFEHNSTDADTGVHGAFDTSSFAELCVYDPTGKQILAVKPQGQLLDLAMGGIFFESREPSNKKVSIESLKASFPEGLYTVRGVSHDGKPLTGTATFTHVIPAAPSIIFPEENAVVSSSGLTVMWEAVTQSLDGAPINTTGYEVIITKEVPDDPNGFSRPTFDVHVPPSVTALSVPSEFLESGTAYELEVLALEVSGNQTITVRFFETQ